MKIDVNQEELQFLMRFCARSIQLCNQLKDRNFKIFDLELGENIEKAQVLYNKLERAYEIENIIN